MGTHSNEVGGEIRVKNQFLKEMDGIVDKGKALHVYVIGATNKPWDLDWAFIRRFQKRILVPLLIMGRGLTCLSIIPVTCRLVPMLICMNLHGSQKDSAAATFVTFVNLLS
jgi:ATP-dependent 26S proteasome regulatory subunit